MMRKLALALVGAAALTFGSGAQAAITVCSGSGSPTLNVSCTPATVAFRDPAVPPGTAASPFSEVINFTNDAAGLYSISAGTSSSSVKILTAVLSGNDMSYNLTKVFDNGFNEQFSFGPMVLALGNYSLTLGGTNSGAGDLAGTVTVSPVPEPATWGLMLLGFGGMGVAMRRRRKQGLTQLA